MVCISASATRSAWTTSGGTAGGFGLEAAHVSVRVSGWWTSGPGKARVVARLPMESMVHVLRCCRAFLCEQVRLFLTCPAALQTTTNLSVFFYTTFMYVLPPRSYRPPIATRGPRL
eukprot:scaffold13647_cov112-Isochrysis_galbana.AAC.1